MLNLSLLLNPLVTGTGSARGTASSGRNELAAGLQIEWTPRFEVEPTVIVNLDDQSAMLVSRLTFDWFENVTIDAGLQIPAGSRGTEYGGIPVGILSVYTGPGGHIRIRLARYF